MSAWRDIRSGVAGKREALIAALKCPQQQQERLLRRVLTDNQHSEFGRRHGFADLRTVADYQRKVPLCSYEDLRVDIKRMMAGEERVLCSDGVLLFEQTGGSTGGEKFFPFTERGLDAMRGALLPWLDDLLGARPRIAAGKAYWSISPQIRQLSRTPCGLPIGIDNDAMYFGQRLAKAISDSLAVPACTGSIGDIDDWQIGTLCHLLACRDLSFVSVWSPTFFLQLLDAIPGNIERIVRTIRSGQLVGSELDLALVADGRRARELEELFSTGRAHWDRLWPGLDTISCWCSASSRKYATELSARFPAVHIQGKGLLATEGIVTLPLHGASSPVLAIASGFYEFVAEDGGVRVAHELETGQTYTVVLTTAAGLYRYRLGDRVTVRDWFEATPCLEYVGREGGGSDLCGEKLTEEFVEKALGGMPGFGVLVPVSNPRPAYLLLLDAAAVDAGSELEVAATVDRALKSNPQYRYARDIGQLPPPAPRRIADPLGTYKRICMQAGQLLGDIKVPALASAWWSDRYLNISVR